MIEGFECVNRFTSLRMGTDGGFLWTQ